jgi:hypothetical protein
MMMIVMSSERTSYCNGQPRERWREPRAVPSRGQTWQRRHPLTNSQALPSARLTRTLAHVRACTRDRTRLQPEAIRLGRDVHRRFQRIVELRDHLHHGLRRKELEDSVRRNHDKLVSRRKLAHEHLTAFRSAVRHRMRGCAGKRTTCNNSRAGSPRNANADKSAV